MRRVKNPNWPEANQLAINDKRGQGFNTIPGCTNQTNANASAATGP